MHRSSRHSQARAGRSVPASADYTEYQIEPEITVMFDELIESTTAKKKSRSGFFIATATVWMLVLSTTIVAGIFAFEGRLSDFERVVMIVPPTPPPPPPPPPPGDNRDRASNKQHPTTELVATQKSPHRINPSEMRPPLSEVNFNDDVSGSGSTGGVPGGVRDGVLNGDPFGVKGGRASDAPPPPRPPDPPKQEAEKPVQQKAPMRSTILQGSALKRVEPSYPEMARRAGVQGTVIIEVTISEKGVVESARAMSGHPLLRDAALNAARAWKWNPTILNNTPVKVIGTITFNFRL